VTIMRFLCAVIAGLLTAVTSAGPALAQQLTVTVKMDAVYLSDQGNFGPVAVLANGNGGVNGSVQFRKFNNGTCAGGYENVGSSGVNGSREYPGPNLQWGSLGEFSVQVYFDSSNGNNPDLTSACHRYLRQQRTAVELQLPRTRYDATAKLETVVALSGTTGGAGGEVALERWAGPGCQPGNPSGSAKVTVAAGQPQGQPQFQDDFVGTHSVRAIYRNDLQNAQSVSACVNYTVGTYIRGRVFQDIDNSGVFDDGEPGLGGVTLTLRRGATTVYTAQSEDLTGLYAFPVTVAGAYTVTQTQPPGYDSTTADELPMQVTGPELTGQDFGEAVIEPSQTPGLLLATPGSAVLADPPPPDESSDGFELVRIGALGAVVLAVLVLVYLLRSRRDEDAQL
jgi:hypothetical protein